MSRAPFPFPLRPYGWIALAGVVLALTTVRIGFFADDFAFVAALDGSSPQQPGRFGLYDFASGDVGENHDLIRRGPFPWFTAPDLKVRFLRPLSSASIALDHALFRHWVPGYHLQNLLFYFVLLATVAVLFRRVLSAAAAPWAFLVFALTASHAEPVGWIASRHVLISGVPAVLGLVAYVVRRERGESVSSWLPVSALIIGLFGSEGAIGAGAFLIAYELVGAPGNEPLGTRAKRAVLPAVALEIYLVVYEVLGYGAAHTTAYLEPLSSPKQFVGAVAQRMPLLVGELLAQLPAGIAFFVAPGRFVVAGLAATAIVAAALFAMRAALEPSDRRALRWLVLGAAMALVVSASALPGSRQLLLPGVGSSALLGVILAQGWQKLGSARAGLVARRAAWVWLFAAHVVLAPLIFLAGMTTIASVGARTAEIAASLDPLLGESGPLAPAQPPSVFLIASDPRSGLFVGAARAVRAPGTAASWCMLSMARATHHVSRIDVHTLAITADPEMLRGAFESLFRGPDRPLRAGDEVDLDIAHIKVLEARNGRPISIEASFRVDSFQDPRLRILAWIDGRLRELPIPPVGKSLDIPWSPGPLGVL